MGDGGPRTLAIDVGGTGLKAVVLDPEGEMVSERIRVETPYPCPPPVLLDGGVVAITDRADSRLGVLFVARDDGRCGG